MMKKLFWAAVLLAVLTGMTCGAWARGPVEVTVDTKILSDHEAASMRLRAGEFVADENEITAVEIKDGRRQSSYYRQAGSGFSLYKIEAAKLLGTELTKQEALAWSRDPRIQELIVLAEGLDRLLYDGFRLVRFRGALVTNNAIDAYAIDRAVYYFNVTRYEAEAWLLASRLMQMSKFKDDGAALVAIEEELLATAGDIFYRLQSYVGAQAALGYMPRMAWGWGFGLVQRPVPPPVWTLKFARY